MPFVALIIAFNDITLNESSSTTKMLLQLQVECISLISDVLRLFERLSRVVTDSFNLIAQLIWGSRDLEVDSFSRDTIYVFCFVNLLSVKNSSLPGKVS
jgi:hypothetical protein